jgi:hypothetical protein
MALERNSYSRIFVKAVFPLVDVALAFNSTDEIRPTCDGKRRLVISSISADLPGAAPRRPAVGAA